MTKLKKDWARYIIEEVDAIHEEAKKHAQELALRSYFDIGETLRTYETNEKIPISQLVQHVAEYTNWGKVRSIWYAIKIYDTFLDPALLPPVSLRQVIKQLTEGQDKPPEEPPFPGLKDMSEYIVYVRKRRCIVCRQKGSEAAHYPISKGAGAPPWQVIPLCHKHHMELHDDRKEFTDKYFKQICFYFYKTIQRLVEGDTTNDRKQ